MSERNDTFEAPLTAPDPFALPKDVRTKIRSCCGGKSCADLKTVEYLWFHLGKHGLKLGCSVDGVATKPPSLEHWLNVVDEGASLGAKWIVVSVQESLSSFPEFVEICQWAQDAHGMCVAVHTTSGDVSEEDLAQLKRLELDQVRLFVSSEAYPKAARLEARGLKVRIADAGQFEKHGCGMPEKMLFVNGDGELYTCGMVEGRQEFHLGDIYSSRFDTVVSDPSLPHAIPSETPYEARGCDGCPPLLGELLKGA